jgi:hypothetical protein
MTYAELKALVANYAHRSDLDSFQDSFNLLAEARIARKVRATEMIQTVTMDESYRIDGATYGLPADFLGMRSLTTFINGASYELNPMSFKELSRFDVTGNPHSYTIYGRKIDFRGTPSPDTEFEMVYFARPAQLVDNTDTNTLLTNYPGLYLSANLAEVMTFTQDLELAQVYISQFQDAADSINALADEIRSQPVTGPAFNFTLGGTM